MATEWFFARCRRSRSLWFAALIVFHINLGLLTPAGMAAWAQPRQPSDGRLQDAVVGVGSHIELEAGTGGGITVSNGRIIRAEDLGARIRVFGRKAGMTTVATPRATYLVTVLEARAFALLQRLRAETARMQGLEVDARAGQVVVHGRLLRLSDWRRLAEIATGLAGADYLFHAEPDPLIRASVESHIRELMRESGLPEPDWALTPAVARLAAARPDLAARFARVLGPYGFAIEKSASVLTPEPLVRVQILVTEIRKRMLRRLGVSWPGSYQAQVLPKLLLPGQPGGESVAVQLDALEESGTGRILASPNLLCRSGKEAEFLAGGEFPIRIHSRRSSEVVWKRYGVLLKIKPVADHSGRVSIGLETEVSTIDMSRSVEGLPGLLTNRIESHFDLRESRTIALSGLIKHEAGSASQGLPGLSSLPVLGSLFSSRDYRDEKSELVVFVTPEVVSETEAGENR